jgi:3-hydroxymyristoyl/3-hydroxydecanoyl-(acyl carrier protein) dehydratase
MADHFAAFSFVDRITEYEPGRRARGRYAVPPAIAEFPSCLVAEAVGQLAAWVAMAHVGFRGRPVAALANETRFLAEVRPGDTLDLAVDIESCDHEAVAYAGRASVGGKDAIELVDCLGPMLAVEEFDSPEAMAERFELIRDGGAQAGRFQGVVAPIVARTGGEPGVSSTGVLSLPESARFFRDHFPRRPVFPATLLLESKIRFALELASAATFWPAGTRPLPSRMTHVKMRSFIPPGAVLEIGAELGPPTRSTATVKLSTRMDDRIVATARLEVVAKEV